MISRNLDWTIIFLKSAWSCSPSKNTLPPWLAATAVLAARTLSFFSGPCNPRPNSFAVKQKDDTRQASHVYVGEVRSTQEFGEIIEWTSVCLRPETILNIRRWCLLCKIPALDLPTGSLHCALCPWRAPTLAWCICSTSCSCPPAPPRAYPRSSCSCSPPHSPSSPCSRGVPCLLQIFIVFSSL